MSCLLNFNWIKLLRETLPEGKGLMGSWARLAARAAFRPGQADYCGHRNDVELASWVGGMVGLKSILGINNRQKAADTMEKLSALGYISYTLDKDTKKLSYTIKDWVVECSGVACTKGAIYATDDYGFLCLPRNITQRLADAQYTFEESDAWLDLWCHTVWLEYRNAFSYMHPVIQFGREGAVLTLEKLGARWGWEKTKVWRFLQKHGDVFPLRKLPGSYGCLVFNTQYPGAVTAVPTDEEITRVLDEIRILGQNASSGTPNEAQIRWGEFDGTDNQKINRMIAVHSQRVVLQNRVALPLYTRIFLCKSCKNYTKDCRRNRCHEDYQYIRPTGTIAFGAIGGSFGAAATEGNPGRRRNQRRDPPQSCYGQKAQGVPQYPVDAAALSQHQLGVGVLSAPDRGGAGSPPGEPGCLAQFAGHGNGFW